jgi:hypothetical protein
MSARVCASAGSLLEPDTNPPHTPRTGRDQRGRPQAVVGLDPGIVGSFDDAL